MLKDRQHRQHVHWFTADRLFRLSVVSGRQSSDNCISSTGGARPAARAWSITVIRMRRSRLLLSSVPCFLSHGGRGFMTGHGPKPFSLRRLRLVDVLTPSRAFRLPVWTHYQVFWASWSAFANLHRAAAPYMSSCREPHPAGCAE